MAHSTRSSPSTSSLVGGIASSHKRVSLSAAASMAANSNNIVELAGNYDDDWYQQPRPVRVARMNANSLQIDKKALSKIMLHPQVAPLQAAVICVAGVFRSGKSFLLANILHVLQHQNGGSIEHIRATLLSAEVAREKSFEWRGGATRHTDGIVMWSRPIVVNVKNRKSKLLPTSSAGPGTSTTGEKQPVAVLLVDTQGAWDQTQSVQGTTKLFAFSALLSSVLINNIQRQVNSQHLDELKFFTQFGSVVGRQQQMANAIESSPNITLFQQLVLLVRDWQYKHDFALGFEGGAKYIKVKLNEPTMAKEVREVCNYIQSCFGNNSDGEEATNERFKCCLLPHPGTNVEECSGALNTLEPVFVEEVAKFIHEIVETVQAKTLGDSAPITFAELHQLALDYAAALANDAELPDLQSMSQAMIDNWNRKLVQQAAYEYCTYMASFMNDSPYALTQADMQSAHVEAKRLAFDLFRQTYHTSLQTENINENLSPKPKPDDDQYKAHAKKLTEAIEAKFDRFILDNTARKRAEDLNNRSILDAALRLYTAKTNDAFKTTEFRLNASDLQLVHEIAHAEAWAAFVGTQYGTLMGSDEAIHECNEAFDQRIIEAYNAYVVKNQQEREDEPFWHRVWSSPMAQGTVTAGSALASIGTALLSAAGLVNPYAKIVGVALSALSVTNAGVWFRQWTSGTQTAAVKIKDWCQRHVVKLPASTNSTRALLAKRIVANRRKSNVVANGGGSNGSLSKLLNRRANSSSPTFGSSSNEPHVNDVASSIAHGYNELRQVLGSVAGLAKDKLGHWLTPSGEQ